MRTLLRQFTRPADQHLTQEAVIADCREWLTAYRLPKLVEFRTELAITHVDEILRGALRDEPTGEAQKA